MQIEKASRFHAESTKFLTFRFFAGYRQHGYGKVKIDGCLKDLFLKFKGNSLFHILRDFERINLLSFCQGNRVMENCQQQKETQIVHLFQLFVKYLYYTQLGLQLLTISNKIYSLQQYKFIILFYSFKMIVNRNLEISQQASAHLNPEDLPARNEEEQPPDEGTHFIVHENADNTIIKQSRIKGKLITYKGPPHPYVNDLFELLEDKQTEATSQFACLRQIQEKQLIIEEWFSSRCKFFNGKLVITPYIVLTGFSFFVIYVTQMAQSLELVTQSTLQTNEYKLKIAEFMPLYGAMITLAAILSVLIENSVWRLVAFIGGFVVPVVLVEFYYLNVAKFVSSATYDIDMIVMLSALAGSILNGLVISSLYHWLKSFVSELYSFLAATGWCLLFAYFAGFYVIVYLLTATTYTQAEIMGNILSQISIPLLCILVCSWFILKARIFDWPQKIIQTAIGRIVEKLEKKLLLAGQPPSQSWLKRNSLKLVSYSIGLLYFFLEIFLFTLLVDTLGQDPINLTETITYSLIVVGMPLYLILGVWIGISDRLPQITYLYTPLLFGIPLMFGFIKLSYTISSIEQTSPIQNVVYYSPLAFLVIWLTLNFLGIDRRKMQLYFLGFLCYFIAFPVGVLYPLYQLSSSEIYLIIAGVLIVVAAGGCLYYFLVYIYIGVKEIWKVRELATQAYPDFGMYSHYDLTNLAQWINSVFFCGSYFLLCENFWLINENKDENATTTESGTIYGLLLLYPVLFFLINKALASESLEITETKQDDLPDLNQEEIQKERQKKRNTQTKIFIIGLLLPIGAFFPLGALNSNKELQTMFYCLAIGIPCAFGVYQLLLAIKHSSEQYQNFFQPFVSSLLWCCVIFPLGVVVPLLSVQFSNETLEFREFAKISVAFGLLVCLCGVTGTSLFFSILLNKEEFERKKREVLTKVTEVIKKNHVLNDFSVLSLLYVRYINLIIKQFSSIKVKHGAARKESEKEELAKVKDRMKKELLDGIPMNVVKYEGPIMDFDHKLINMAAYKELQEKLSKKPSKIEVEMNRCTQFFYDCLCCQCGLEEVQDLNQKRDQEIINLRQLLKIDEDYNQLLAKTLPQLKLMPKVEGQSQRNAMMQLELEPMSRMLNLNQQFKRIEELKSQKTDALESIPLKEYTLKQVSNTKKTEFFSSMQQNDKYLACFFHEIFMEFANQDQDLPPSICYKDFQQFCRLSGLNLSLIQYKQFAKQPWLHQTNTLSEYDFAALLKSTCDQNKPFESLKELAVEKIYPNLILSLKSLMENLKSQNRAFLNNPLNFEQSPFVKVNFEGQFVHGPQTVAQKVKQELQKQDQAQVPTSKDDGTQIRKIEPEKTRRQNLIEFEVRSTKIKEEYARKLPYCKGKLYECADSLRTHCCQPLSRFCDALWNPFKSKVEKEQIVIDVFNQRKSMPPWSLVSRQIIDTLFLAAEEYDRKYLELQNKGYNFRINFGNILALMLRFQEIYGLATLALDDRVGWFESEEAASNQYNFISYQVYFWIVLATSVLYGVFGVIAQERVSQNIYGLNDDGAPATFPQPQFMLAKFFQYLSGQFLLIMTKYIEAFVCDYDEPGNYYMYANPDVECASPEHFIYMGLAFFGSAIYYPLSTFLSPNFQFSDHSLDMKYKSSFLIIYIQCKLLISGVSTLFVASLGEADGFKYQLFFSSFVMIFLIMFYVRMRPCYILWFNTIELLGLLVVLSIYIGGLIILYMEERTIGLVFTISCISLLLLVTMIYVVTNLLGYRQREQIEIEKVFSGEAEDLAKQPSAQKHPVTLEDIKKEGQVREKEIAQGKFLRIHPFDEEERKVMNERHIFTVNLEPNDERIHSLTKIKDELELSNGKLDAPKKAQKF